MQFLRLDQNMRLNDLAAVVGQGNLDTTLAVNSMSRMPSVSQSYQNMKASYIQADTPDVSFERKQSLLNTVTSDAEVFEYVALQNEYSWKLFDAAGTLDGYIRIPDTFTIPSSTKVIGGTSGSIDKKKYMDSMQCLKSNRNVSPEIFNEYAPVSASKIINGASTAGTLYQNFKIPFGEVSLYSSLTDTMVDFPVYPTDISDGVKANYDTMPEMLYQYEPWQIYKSSGPRTVSMSFDMHRDMWTGDHRDGLCNKLIRFCEAACYPRYNGAAVNTAISTLYIHGKPFISGIITDVSPKWDTSSPLGLDNWYLHVTLTITFTEVSQEPLNYDVMLEKGLIG